MEESHSNDGKRDSITGFRDIVLLGTKLSPDVPRSWKEKDKKAAHIPTFLSFGKIRKFFCLFVFCFNERKSLLGAE